MPDISPEQYESIKNFVNKNCTEHEKKLMRYHKAYVEITIPLKEDKLKAYFRISNKLELYLKCNEKRDGEYHYIFTHLKKYIEENNKDKQGKLEELKEDDWGYKYVRNKTINIDKLDFQMLKEFINFFDKFFTKEEKLNSKEHMPPKENYDIHHSKDGSVALYELCLEKALRLPLNIPNYQRIYCWRGENVNCLLEDIFKNWNENKKKKYRLGTIILHHNGDKYDIVDGQQRLITLSILLSELKVDVGLLCQKIKSKKSKRHIEYNDQLIKIFCNENGLLDKYSPEEICEFTNLLEFSVIVLEDNAKKPSLDLAYIFFSNQNSKGVALTDYDLLKAHHLRWLIGEKDISEEDKKGKSQEFADEWNRMIEEGRKDKKEEKDGVAGYERVLDNYIYRLRRWTNSEECEIGLNDYHIKSEYEATPVIERLREELPAVGKKKKFNFNEPIQGGIYFFEYVQHHRIKYNSFKKTEEYKNLHKEMIDRRRSFLFYRDVIEGLLFAYYLKFDKRHLSDALAVIMRCVLQHRYKNSKASKKSILECFDDEDELSITSALILMINRSSSHVFFLSEALDMVKKMKLYPRDCREKIQIDMNAKAIDIVKELKDKISEPFKGINEICKI